MKSYHHGNLREALLKAALETISKEGPAALSLRELARKVGVSAPATYRHFADKEALLAALIENGFRDLDVRLRKELEESRAPRKRFVEIGTTYVTFILDFPELSELMFGGAIADFKPYPSLFEISEGTFQMVVETVEGMKEEGLLKNCDANELALFAWASMHGLGQLAARNQLPMPAKERKAVLALTKRVAGHILEGILKR